MILYSTRTSPFGRKVRIVVARLGLADAVTEIAAMPLDPADPLIRHNPLGKMPCLVLDDGTAIYDSPVILDYLDRRYHAALVPPDPLPRLMALTGQALADGILSAAMLMGSERMFHPEEHVSGKWIEHQRAKVVRGLAAFAPNLPEAAPCRIDALSLACALGYLDWRKPLDWRSEWPVLVSWLDTFRAAVPEFDATAS